MIGLKFPFGWKSLSKNKVEKDRDSMSSKSNKLLGVFNRKTAESKAWWFMDIDSIPISMTKSTQPLYTATEDKGHKFWQSKQTREQVNTGTERNQIREYV